MLRTATLLCLAACSLGTFGFAIASHTRVLYGDISFAHRDWLYVHLENGFVRVAWLSSRRPFVLEIDPRRRHYTFAAWSSRCEYPTITHARAKELQRVGLGPHEVRWRQRFEATAGQCPPVYLSLIRTRAGLLSVVFAAFPVCAWAKRLSRNGYKGRKRCCCFDDAV